MTAVEARAPVIETAQGKLEGAEKDGIYIFKGIPYAAPPTGARRWLPPEPAEPWAGIREARTWGSSAPQNTSPLNDLLGGGMGPQDEDCLYLNVWTPGLDDAKRPVMVWIHGGAFAVGAAYQAIYGGRRLARHGDAVVVTINYRLGALGFLNLNEATKGAIPATGNEGLLDQVMALRWVRDNIAAFGGDPGNVTIFGESAGGMSVGCLLAMEDARGLFHKAIPQSGACHTAAPRERARLVGEALMAALDCDADRLRKASPADILKAQADITLGRVADYPLTRIGGMPFQPVIDGAVLKERPVESVKRGSAAGIPMLIGSTLDEFRLFAAMDPSIAKLDDAGLVKRLGFLLPEMHIDGLITAYRDILGERGVENAPGDIFAAIQTDRVFRVPALRLLETQASHEQRVYSYLFDWPSPLAGGSMRSCHAVELGFVFGTHAINGADKFFGNGPEAEKLARAAMGAWTRFARNAEPGWAPYETSTRETAIFGQNTHVADAPHDDARTAWDAITDEVVGAV